MAAVGVLVPEEGRMLANDIFNREFRRINDDWTKRYSELRLGRDFDLVPAPVEESAR